MHGESGRVFCAKVALFGFFSLGIAGLEIY